jgi:hypothetical protein
MRGLPCLCSDSARTDLRAVSMTTDSTSQPADSLLQTTASHCFRALEIFTAGRFWLVRTLGLSFLLSTLFSGGLDNRLYHPELESRYPDGYAQKIDHPLANVSQGVNAKLHAAKLNFRLTVPTLLHLLGGHASSLWLYPWLAVAAKALFLTLTCLFVQHLTGDRVCALLVCLSLAFSYIGSIGMLMYYDIFAQCQILAALLPWTPWPVQGLLAFTAAFTDERGALACSLLLAAPFVCPEWFAGQPARRPVRCLAAIFIGLGAYLLGRFVLLHYCGLPNPMGDVGPTILAHNTRYWRTGCWLALEGNWLLVLLGMLALARQHQRLALAAFMACFFLIIGPSFVVLDWLRSVTYIFPAVLMALGILARSESRSALRLYCLLALLFCLLGGDFDLYTDPTRSLPLWIEWLKSQMAQWF